MCMMVGISVSFMECRNIPHIAKEYSQDGVKMDVEESTHML